MKEKDFNVEEVCKKKNKSYVKYIGIQKLFMDYAHKEIKKRTYSCEHLLMMDIECSIKFDIDASNIPAYCFYPGCFYLSYLNDFRNRDLKTQHVKDSFINGSKEEIIDKCLVVSNVSLQNEEYFLNISDIIHEAKEDFYNSTDLKYFFEDLYNLYVDDDIVYEKGIEDYSEYVELLKLNYKK